MKNETFRDKNILLSLFTFVIICNLSLLLKKKLLISTYILQAMFLLFNVFPLFLLVQIIVYTLRNMNSKIARKYFIVNDIEQIFWKPIVLTKNIVWEIKLITPTFLTQMHSDFTYKFLMQYSTKLYYLVCIEIYIIRALTASFNSYLLLNYKTNQHVILQNIVL